MPSRPPTISHLIERFPDDRPSLVAAADRIAQLSNACGCGEGAAAMTVAMALAAAYWVWPDWSGGRVSALWAIPFVFVAAGAGKLAGILVARLRLTLLYRRLHTKYARR